MSECNTDDCTNDAVIDWGVCGDCFRDDMHRFAEKFFEKKGIDPTDDE